MIQKIIGKFTESEVFNFIQRKVKHYKIAHIVILLFALGIAILPFHFNWLESVTTEPREAVAKLYINDEFMGTAFLISPTQILTARHVVEGRLGQSVVLSFDQAKIPFTVDAVVDYYDARVSFSSLEEYFQSDVALITVDLIKHISPLKLGNSNEFKVGDIIVMGYGNDDWSEPDGKITSDTFHGSTNLYKLDASVNKGHSGSPVVTKDKNQVVGIVVGKPDPLVTLQTQGQILSGENVVLKINQAERILQRGGLSIR